MSKLAPRVWPSCHGNHTLVLRVGLVRREAAVPPFALGSCGERVGPVDAGERDVGVLVAGRGAAAGPQAVEQQAERQQRGQRGDDGGPGPPETHRTSPAEAAVPQTRQGWSHDPHSLTHIWSRFTSIWF